MPRTDHNHCASGNNNENMAAPSHSKVTYAVLWVIAVFGVVSAQNDTDGHVVILASDHKIQFQFNPDKVEGLEENHMANVHVSAVVNITSSDIGVTSATHHPAFPGMYFMVVSEDSKIATIESHDQFLLDEDNKNEYHFIHGSVSIDNITGAVHFVAGDESPATNDTHNTTAHFSLKGHFLGRTTVNFYALQERDDFQKYVSDKQECFRSLALVDVDGIEDPSAAGSLRERGINTAEEYGRTKTGTKPGNSTSSCAWKELPTKYSVAVVRENRILDKIFIAAVTVLVVCANIGMGCKVDLAVVKEVMRRPIAPVIGFCCQYIIMPLTSFALIRVIGLSGGVALGLFAAGCAPGGTGSNMYTYLLNGDVSLSVTMTLVSVFASLGMFPLWLFTLGRYVSNQDTNLHIPFQNILISLASLLIAVAIGIVIRLKRPKAAKFILKLLKPFYILLIIFMFTFGVYTNLYIFKLITPPLVVAGCLLPYVGFVLAGFVAFISRQPWQRVYTIAIETGIQNAGIAIILMKYSLPQPEADLSLVAPVVVSMFSPMPLWIAITSYMIRQKCKKKNAKSQQDPGDKSADPEAQTDLLGAETKRSSGSEDSQEMAPPNNNGTIQTNGHLQANGIRL